MGRRRSRRRRPEREEPPRGGADAGDGRREDLVGCERAREELMEAHHREQQQIGVVRARRLEGSGNFGPRVAGQGGTDDAEGLRGKQRGKMEDKGLTVEPQLRRANLGRLTDMLAQILAKPSWLYMSVNL